LYCIVDYISYDWWMYMLYKYRAPVIVIYMMMTNNMTAPAIMLIAYIKIFMTTRSTAMISGQCIYILICPFKRIFFFSITFTSFHAVQKTQKISAPKRQRNPLPHKNDIIIASFFILIHYCFKENKRPRIQRRIMSESTDMPTGQ